MPTDDLLCPVHGDAALDPNHPSGAPASCPACAQLGARLLELQVLARALPIFVPPAVDRDVIRARLVAAAPAAPATTTAPRTTRMTRVRWGLGLGLFAGAAV
ncbi:MAG: hypothetical protein QOI66_4897, partial [Myxococcales bacterium]|nr:hypothetical protein [Myxococcales bacterium]